MKKISVQPKLGPAEGDASELFKPASWLNKIVFIQHLIKANNVLISVLGEPNGGKSTFANLIASMLEPNIKTVIIKVSPLFEPKVLMHQIGERLNHSGEMNLKDFIASRKQEEMPTLIVLDDAHYLPLEFVATILECIEQQEKPIFHVCLVSNAALGASLSKLAAQYMDLIHTIELGPLTEKETENLLRDRFQGQPYLEAQLTEESIQQFYQLTEGSLVGINTQIAGCFQQPTNVKSSKKQWTIMSFSAGFAVVALGSMYILNHLSVDSGSQANVITQLPQPILHAVMEEPIKVAQAIQLPSKIPVFTLAAARQELQATSLRKVNFMPSQDDAAPNNDTFVVMDKVVVIPKVLGSKAARDSVAHVQKARVVIAHAAAKTAVFARKTNAIAKVTVAAFTIQLLASHNKADLQKFAKIHQLQGKAKIFRSQNRGLNWYVLAYGQYQQRESARQALNHLPKNLVKLKPWVRGLAELQSLG